MPIISRYVKAGLQAFVSLFKTKAKGKESGAKMGGKLLSSRSENVLNIFSNTNEKVWFITYEDLMSRLKIELQKEMLV